MEKRILTLSSEHGWNGSVRELIQRNLTLDKNKPLLETVSEYLMGGWVDEPGSVERNIFLLLFFWVPFTDLIQLCV